MLTDTLIAIDTDNAVIRFYEGRARVDGVPEYVLLQLRKDLATLAAGVSSVSDARFQLSVMTSEAK